VADLSGHRYRNNSSYSNQPPDVSASSHLSAGSLPSPTVGTARHQPSSAAAAGSSSYSLSDPRAGLGSPAYSSGPGHSVTAHAQPVRPAPTHHNRPAPAAGHPVGHYDGGPLSAAAAGGLQRHSSGPNRSTVTTNSRLGNSNSSTQQTVYSSPSNAALSTTSSSSSGSQPSAAAGKITNRPPALHGAINPISLEQRINKVISQNQAIVETLGKIIIFIFSLLCSDFHRVLCVISKQMKGSRSRPALKGHRSLKL
jgi:hypothetical protein